MEEDLKENKQNSIKTVIKAKSNKKENMLKSKNEKEKGSKINEKLLNKKRKRVNLSKSKR